VSEGQKCKRGNGEVEEMEVKGPAKMEALGEK
jgi:hypothetical protein